MQTVTQTTQTINIKTPVPLTTAKMENFFEQLSEALNLPLASGPLTEDLLAEKKVEVQGKVFDLFDFTEAVQTLTDKDLEQFIDFLRDDFDSVTASKIFDLI